MGYTKWDNFLSVVERAKTACVQAGHGCEDHFAGVGKMVSLGSGAEREIEDLVLSRYACYRTAQTRMAGKSQSFAQTSFAIRTRRQEIADQEANEHQPLSEDERRCVLREEMKKHNKHLSSAAKNADVKDGMDYAVFQRRATKVVMDLAQRVWDEFALSISKQTLSRRRGARAPPRRHHPAERPKPGA